jgi:hypothetical protein
MEYVEVTNRTTKPLTVTWDGRRHALPPGKSSHPSIVAEAAKRQNIVMGSEDPYTLEVESLVGVEAWGDNCSPLVMPATVARERWNRAKLPASQQNVEVIQGNGLYSPRVDGSNALPLDSTFVNPK